jgi:hypothetical protein
MSPDKLFDYLDGKLPEHERTELEQRLISDEQLQRELAMARQIHRAMPDSREVFLPSDEVSGPNRGAVLSRRVVAAFGLLVLLNVFIGIAFIIGFNKKPNDFGPKEAAVRKQLTESMQKAAAAALPTPSLDVDEVKITVAAGESDSAAKEIISQAEKYGGSGTKGLPDKNGLLVFVEVPAQRTDAFFERFGRIGGAPSTPRPEVAKMGKVIIQLRILERPKP